MEFIDQIFSTALAYIISNSPRGTQARLAKAVRITPTHVSTICSGKTGCSEEVRRSISSFFNYNYEDFLNLGRTINSVKQPSSSAQHDKRDLETAAYLEKARNILNGHKATILKIFIDEISK